MMRAVERFLRSLSDEELARFAEERAAWRPPYWGYLRLALQVEAYRRGLELPEQASAARQGRSPREGSL